MRSDLLAPLSIILGMMVLAFSDNFIWMISDLMSVWQYHALRAALMLPVMAAVIWWAGEGRQIAVKRPGAVAARAAFSVSALILYFSAIPAVGVSLAAAGLFTSPLFVAAISALAYRERVGWHRAVGAALGFAGVCLVLEIGSAPLTVMTVAPMFGGFLYALNVIWTRQYCQQETASALAFWNMGAFLVVGSAGILVTPWLAGQLGHIEGIAFAIMPVRMPGATEFAIVFAMGIAGAVGMFCLAKGYAAAPSSYAALFDYSFLFWVPFFAWILWGETLSLPMAGGMVLIVAAGWLAAAGGSKEAVQNP